MIYEDYLDKFPPFPIIHIVNDIQGDINTDGNERKS